MTRLPPDFPGQAITPQLDPDEKVIWCARLRQGLFLRAADVINIVLSVLGTGLAIMLVDQARTQNRLGFFVTVIALSALYWLIGRFFLGAWQRSKTYYVATDRQVIVASA